MSKLESTLDVVCGAGACAATTERSPRAQFPLSSFRGSRGRVRERIQHRQVEFRRHHAHTEGIALTRRASGRDAAQQGGKKPGVCGGTRLRVAGVGGTARAAIASWWGLAFGQAGSVVPTPLASACLQAGLWGPYPPRVLTLPVAILASNGFPKIDFFERHLESQASSCGPPHFETLVSMKRRHETTSTDTKVDALIVLQNRLIAARDTRNRRELTEIMKEIEEISDGFW